MHMYVMDGKHIHLLIYQVQYVAFSACLTLQSVDDELLESEAWHNRNCSAVLLV